MVQIIPAHQRHFTDFGWLQTYWLFSFAHYYDPENVQFGSLRVLNDDVVQPQKGFGTHAHAEMEIVTIVLAGEVTHQDSLGTKAVLRAGDVQRMSAGTGIRHSEFNLGQVAAHFYQIWFLPRQSGLVPGYEQKSFAGINRNNRLLPVASGQGIADAVTFHTDATIYLADVQAQHALTHHTDASRQVFLYMMEGDLEVEGKQIHLHDQARIHPHGALTLTAISDTQLLLIDIAKS